MTKEIKKADSDGAPCEKGNIKRETKKREGLVKDISKGEMRAKNGPKERSDEEEGEKEG